MSDRAKNHILIICGLVTASVTVLIQVVGLGDLKGQVMNILATHEHRLNTVEGETKVQGKQITNIEGRLHGIASQIGRVPGKVATKLQLQEGACGDP